MADLTPEELDALEHRLRDTYPHLSVREKLDLRNEAADGLAQLLDEKGIAETEVLLLQDNIGEMQLKLTDTKAERDRAVELLRAFDDVDPDVDREFVVWEGKRLKQLRELGEGG
tara:strand:- start:1994 stop:2335 length:342 start_codon:yes stop_codon:yes gene_type:complete